MNLTIICKLGTMVGVMREGEVRDRQVIGKLESYEKAEM